MLKRRETRASQGINSGSDSEKGSDEGSDDDGSGSGSDDGSGDDSGDDVCSKLSNFSEYRNFNKEEEERADK